jgi:hypothetical protein
MTRIVVVPDTQVHEGVDMSYLNHISQYIVEKKPDYVVHIGDHWDMPSLSSYDFGKRQFEGRRYRNDIDYGNVGMDILTQPILDEVDRLERNKKKRWQPKLHFLMGNHENRISRAVDNDAKLEGAIGLEDLNLGSWQVHAFLDPLFIDGVAFNHYFTTGLAGRPASTASAQLNKQHMSCIAGHQQGLQIATGKRADGALLTSVIAGSGYPHEEAYLGAQGNKHWRGILVLNDVHDGEFDLMPVSLKYLHNKYN